MNISITYSLRLIIGIVFSFSIYGHAQTPPWEWAQTHGGFNTDAGMAIATDNSNFNYNVGVFQDDTLHIGAGYLLNRGIENISFVKRDENGNIIWTKAIGGNQRDAANAVAVDDLGFVYIAGGFQSDTLYFDNSNYVVNSGSGSYDMFVAKFDTSGNFIWSLAAGSTGQEFVNSICVDLNGNCYIAGSFVGAQFNLGSTTLSSAGSRDMFLARINLNGTVGWATRFGGTNFDQASCVAFDGDSSIALTGHFASQTIIVGPDTLVNLSTGGFSDILATKIKIDGTILWAISGRGYSNDESSGVAFDATGALFVVGSYESGQLSFGTTSVANGSPSYNGFIAALDSIGNCMWLKSVAGSGNDFSSCVSVAQLGYIVVSGRFESSMITSGTVILNKPAAFNTSSDVYLIAYDANGVALWGEVIGSNGSDWVYGSAIDENDGFYITGSFYGAVFELDSLQFANTTPTTGNAYLCKMKAFDVNVEATSPISNYISVYPIPASDKLTILNSSESAPVTEVSIININGAVQYEERKVFNNIIEIDLSDYAKGLYIIRIVCNGETASRRILVL